MYAALVDGTVIAFPVVTGVDEINNDVLESAYPNPASNLFNIVLKPNTVAEAFNITDVTGKVLITQPVLNNSNTLSVDVSSLAAGTYLINIFANGEMAVQRFSVVK
ncbi:MAG: T9SS type A sorting domain-containing protein [Bacteroidetes bacterium]|nr:T9SS type A sorting domain-containing protein [Bacteroidota bacterium]